MILKVKHVKQNGPTHCGVACLEMIYKYFGIDSIDQNQIWNNRKTLRPDGTDYFMKTRSMIEDSISQGFNVSTGQITLNDNLCIESLENFIKNKLPVIATIQWEANPKYGHFVVIIGIEKQQILYLNPEKNGSIIKSNINDFINGWKKTSEEVIGGEFIVFGNKKHKLKVENLHATNFNIPKNLKSFCIKSVTLN